MIISEIFLNKVIDFLKKKKVHFKKIKNLKEKEISVPKIYSM